MTEHADSLHLFRQAATAQTGSICLAYERHLAALRQQLAAANERADKAEAALAHVTP